MRRPGSLLFLSERIEAADDRCLAARVARGRYERKLCHTHEACARLALGKHLAGLVISRDDRDACGGRRDDHLKSDCGLQHRRLLAASSHCAVWNAVGCERGSLRPGDHACGVALGFAIILGVSSFLGAVVPLVTMHRDQLLTSAGLLTLVGLAVILAGVAVCGRAGVLRETVQTRQQGQGSFTAGFIICVLSGIGSSFMSLALNQAAPIFRAAEFLGASPTRSLNAVWPVLLGGGFVMNAAYCVFRLTREHTLLRFADATGANLGLVLVMAVLWSGSNFVYGAGARRMGPLGLVLGWPAFMAAIVLTANAWGYLTGEWRGAGRRVVKWVVAGILLLIAGIFVVGLAARES